jgi:Zn-dependent protease with chaperone function
LAVDFQTQQLQARQSTGRLVLLFSAGVVAIIGVVTLLLMGLFYYSSGVVDPLSAIVVAAPATGLLVGGASLVKSSQIRSGGGSYVASSLGGRPVDFNTLDPAEKQLCNVVEEMAIASGLPVPAVFVLDDEAGINAFAAGWSPDSAAIGVTRGALTHFTRRELQGVIGHEMAHIANGDTRVKTRIIAWVFGIAVISVVGRLILNNIWFAPRLNNIWFPPRRSNREGGNAAFVFIAAGFGLLVIGAIGTWFGRLVQAAVSRQREYLADASAVQFTRDPSSIGEALMKIAAVGSNNNVRSAHAAETQHLFFASALGGGFATHPPIEDRIRRLVPDWDGSLPEIDISAAPVDPVRDWVRAEVQAQREVEERLANPLTAGFVSGEESELWRRAARSPLGSGSGPTTGPGAWTQSAGPSLSGLSKSNDWGATAASPAQAPSFAGPSDAHVDYARHLLSQIPEQTQSFLHTRQGAVAAITGLLAAADATTRTRQLQTAGPVLGFEPDYLDAASGAVAGLHRSLQLPAIDLALHSIAELPYDYKQRFLATLEGMSNGSETNDLFRWMLGRSVVRHIADQDADGDNHGQYQLRDLAEQAILLYAVIAHFNSSGTDRRQAAFGAALVATGLGGSGGMDGVQLPPIESLTFDRLDQALDQLAQLSPQGRRDLVQGAAAAVHQDGRTSVEEAELIRVVADAVRLPMPPLLPVGSPGS